MRFMCFLTFFLLLSLSSFAHDSHDPAAAARLEIEEAEIAPWTHLAFANDAENFQFLIVSDRTGGCRPGVFPEALRKAELLRPEFIMSVGDLIQGYTEDRDEIGRQWDEFEAFFEGLDIPFFYVPGNHDFTNDVMAEIWQQRFGRSYYHFLYRDVLFLCVNTQDGEITRISPEQVEYFRRAVDENSQVRWTLLFLHKPLWIYDDEDAPGWSDLEDLLQEREYTVFAGHFHRYTKHVRRDRRYFVLATTGGGSDLGGPDRGQFDHVVWVTMTEEGPQLANLLVDGIWDEDIFTTRSARLLEQLAGLEATPRLSRPDGTLLTEAGFRLTNDEDIPMRVEAGAADHPGLGESWALETSVPPNSVSDFLIPFEAGDGSPLSLTVKTFFEPEDHRSLEYERSFSLAAEPLRPVPTSEHGLKPDGDLSDRPCLKYAVEGAGSGGQAEFSLLRDETMLYVKLVVDDDHVLIADPPARRWQHDYVELRIDTRPFARRGLIRSQWERQTYVYMACFPVLGEESAQIWRRDDFPEELVMQQSHHEWGYRMELAIPLDYLAERGGVDRLKGFSFNLTLVDRDEADGEEMKYSWQTAWHLDEAAVGAGSFLLE